MDEENEILKEIEINPEMDEELFNGKEGDEQE